MSKTPSKRRLAENEAVFRDYNEQVKKGFDEISRVATEDRQNSFVNAANHSLSFYCECSDEDCVERIRLKLDEYTQIHQHRSRFVILAGHETSIVEKVVAKNAIYYTVEKYEEPALPDEGLQKT